MCGLYWLMGYNVIVSTWINYSFNINEKMNLFVIPLTHRHNTTLIPLLVPTKVMSAQYKKGWHGHGQMVMISKLVHLNFLTNITVS